MSEMERIPSDKTASKSERRWIVLLLILLVLLFGAWLWISPSGFWGKLNAVGYSVCHQITERSFVLDGLQSPICSRCAGMYLGALLTIILQFTWGRHGKFPPKWMMFFLGLGLLAFAFDGINSSMGSIAGMKSLYETNNLIRLVTGSAMGLGIGALLAPVFNQTAWADWLRSSAFERWYRLPLLVVLLAGIGLAVYSQKAVFFYPTNILMVISILFILWLIHTTLALFILKRTNQARQWRDLTLPALLGLAMVFVQIGVLSLARYLITGTWLPFGH